MKPTASQCRVLIPFGTPYLYGMERAVMEIFGSLRPHVIPEFQLSSMALKRRAPVVQEVQRRRLAHCFLPDHKDWPRFGRPRSLRGAVDLIAVLVRGSLSTLRRALHCDVLYIASSIAATAVIAAAYCRLMGKKVVYHFHDLQPRCELVRLWGLLASNFVHNTNLSREHVLDRYPFLRGKSHVVLPPITECRTDVPLPSEVEGEFAGGRNVVFVGQVSAHKGVDLLLEAFRLVARSHPDARLHIVGGCNETFQASLDRLLAASNGRVRIWGYREDASEWMRRAYVYVHPSPPSRCHESFGRGAVEAMAFAVPCVCFRSGALQEIVVHEKTGLICEVETAACLAEGIQRFLDDPGFRNSCGREAHTRFVEEYSQAAIRRQWLELFGVGV